MKKVWLVFVVIAASTLLGSCAAVKSIARTADDIANAACELFGQEHPQEFERLVRQVLPLAAEQEAEADGFNPVVLCKVKEVLQPFIDDLLEQQSGMALGLQPETNGGATP